MALYQGKVVRGELAEHLVNLLTTPPVGSSEPYWERVGSGTATNEGYILKSSGKTGEQDIYVRLYAFSSESFYVSTMENYIPNNVVGIAGTRTGETNPANVKYYNGSYPTSYPVNYFLSFDRDKIMLVASSERTMGAKVNTLLWIGMPQRLDPYGDKTNGAVSIACSKVGDMLLSNTTNNTLGNLSNVMTLKTRAGDSAISRMITPTVYRSKGWGEEIALPDIFLETGTEGIRSLMDGVHPLYHTATNPDFKDGDEITRNSKRYTIFNIAYDGVAGNQDSGYFGRNCFPSAWMAVEQLL